MLLRALLLLTTMLLLTAALASVLEPREAREGRGARALAEVPDTVPAVRRTRVVQGRMPSEQPVVARQGDIVELRVTSRRPDVADFPELGLDVPVGPGVTGDLRFVAERAGRFEARSVVDGRRIGVLRVRPRAGS